MRCEMRVAAEVIRNCEDGAKIVGGVAPLGGEPGVVEVEPADDGADVEGGLHGVELVTGAGDACPAMHDEAGEEWAEELGAGGILERFEATAEGVHQAVARGLVSERGFYFVVESVVDDVDDGLVEGRADVGDVAGHGTFCYATRSSRRLPRARRACAVVSIFVLCLRLSMRVIS